MTTVYAAFATLLFVEALGTGASLVIYLRDSSWRSTAVGRHLAYYMAALFGLIVLALASMFVRVVWFVVPILGGHALYAALIWQRFALIWRAQRRDDAEHQDADR